MKCPKCSRAMKRKGNDWWCSDCRQWLAFLKRHDYEVDTPIDPSIVVVNGREEHRHFPVEEY